MKRLIFTYNVRTLSLTTELLMIYIDYYQLYSISTISKQETEAPIYNQIVELEAIELHKLKRIIESKGGLCLDLNTDCISCVFKKDT